MGTGGAPEGVLAAAAVSIAGGQMLGKLVYSYPEEKDRAVAMGIKDTEREYSAEELAGGDVIFAATGVTSGNILSGVKLKDNRFYTETLLMIKKTRSIYRICSSSLTK